MAKQHYEIDLPVYEGPLDLLLHLIERSELDITALSLAEVTDQFLQQVKALKEEKVSELIDFIVIGARLMVIKSRALLPTPPVILDGEEENEDPAEALIRQLKQYQQFKTVARFFQERLSAGMHTYLRLSPPPKVEAKLDTSNASSDRLYQLMLGVLLRMAEREDSVAVAAPRKITVEGQMSKLRSSVRRKKRLAFNDLLSEQTGRTELSVTLLAVLELIKRREVVASQEEMFGRIQIERAEKEIATAAEPSMAK